MTTPRTDAELGALAVARTTAVALDERVVTGQADGIDLGDLARG